ncbi:MAG: glycosyltransferase family 39 protein [Kiritimatiellae bacterium]|nr:glycosyltransferase family 39 protein [Kiritimatiellia bacterium]
MTERTNTHGDAHKTAWQVGMLVGLLLLVAAARILFAWTMRHETNADFAIVQLMVRHILAGEPWPVFFYGQNYMGSLEPLTSALLASVCGYSTFAVNCGTALFGIAAAVITALWARRIGGWLAACCAAACCVVGPVGYVHYMASPRGGYGTLLFFTVALLACGVRMLARECEGTPSSWRDALLLGVMAGLGLWCNMLVVPAIGAVAVCFLLWRWRAALRFRLWAGVVAGFLLGSIPLWSWNLRHDWSTFGMGGSLSFYPPVVMRHLRLLFTERIPQLVGVADAPAFWYWSVLPATVAPLLIVLISWRPPRRGAWSVWTALSLSAIGCYLLCFVPCFAFSQFASVNSPRYMLPLVPFLAILGGAACALARPRALRIVAGLAVMLQIAWQVGQLHKFTALAERRELATRRYAAVVDALLARGVTAAYAGYPLFIMNLLADERICFSDPKIERIPAYARRIEHDPSPAVVENLGGVNFLVRSSDGRGVHANVDSMRLDYALAPPTTAVRDATDITWAAAGQTSGVSIARMLCDRDAGTAVHAEELRDQARDTTITIALREPTVLNGIRLWGAEQAPFGSWRVEGRAEAGDDYISLSSETPYAHYFWSGPRIFWDRPHHRQEVRFAPTRLRELRLHFAPGPDRAAFRICEVQLLAPDPDAAGAVEAAPAPAPLLDTLRERGINRLYAERWTANAVHLAGTGSVWTSRSPRAQTDRRLTEKDDPERLLLDAHTAVLMPPAGVPSMRAVLSARTIPLRETALPPFGTLFDVPPGLAGAPWLERRTGIRFLGSYALLDDANEWAMAMLSVADAAENAERLDFLLAGAPDCVPVARRRLALLRDQSEATTALRSELDRRLALLTIPTLGSPARFRGDYEWLGCRLIGGKSSYRPGDILVVRHYWRAPHPPPPERLAVFIHFVGPNKFIFQDDHALLDGIYAWPSDADAPWTDDREVVIPADAPPGRYELCLGVCNAQFPTRRFSVATTLPQRRRAVKVADAFTVIPLTSPKP